jgi:hypothetical protein
MRKSGNRFSDSITFMILDGFNPTAGCGGAVPAADGTLIPAARHAGGLAPSGRYGSNYGRALKRIGGVLPQFGEATAFLETR